MKKEIGWTEKTPEGRREISVKIFGGQVYWAWKFEDDVSWDESMRPEEHHWEELERLYRNRRGRGQGSEAELQVVVARTFGEPRGKPRQSDAAPSKKPGNAA